MLEHRPVAVPADSGTRVVADQQAWTSSSGWRPAKPAAFARSGSSQSGIASAGVAAAARERGCAKLYWTTREDNATARSLYDRIARFNGFIRYDYALD